MPCTISPSLSLSPHPHPLRRSLPSLGHNKEGVEQRFHGCSISLFVSSWSMVTPALGRTMMAAFEQPAADIHHRSHFPSLSLTLSLSPSKSITNAVSTVIAIIPATNSLLHCCPGLHCLTSPNQGHFYCIQPRESLDPPDVLHVHVTTINMAIVTWSVPSTSRALIIGGGGTNPHPRQCSLCFSCVASLPRSLLFPPCVAIRQFE